MHENELSMAGVELNSDTELMKNSSSVALCLCENTNQNILYAQP